MPANSTIPTERIFTFRTSDGYVHHVTAREPEVVRRTVVCLHGIQSHAGWYQFTASQLAAAGYTVWFVDRRGSGRNLQQRGHADHGSRLLNDVRDVLHLARRKHPERPVTLLGLSWGGKTAAAFAATHPELIDSLVLLYPGLMPRIRPNFVQRQLLKLARFLDIRHRKIPIPLNDPSLFTDDPHWQQFIASDDLTLREMTVGLLNSGRDLDAVLRRQKQLIRCPVLLMSAGRDRIIDNKRTTTLVESFGSNDVTMIVYPEASHTLEFDKAKDQYIRDLRHWLDQLPNPPRPATQPSSRHALQ